MPPPAASRPSRWRDVLVDGARVRLLEAGEGEPLLFLHGWGLTPRAYRAGITRLTAAGVRVLAPALPGFGGSDGPPLRDVSLDWYADRMAGLLEALDLGRPAFVAGHSFGGGVSLQLAARHPHLVRSLTLVNSVGGAPGRRGLADASWLRWAVGATAELDPRDVLRCAPGVLRDLVPNAFRKPVTSLLTARVALSASLADVARGLVDDGVPVLFVWGDRDRLIAPGALAGVASGLPEQVVPGRHGWLFSQPEEFATLLHNALVVHAMLERKKRGDDAPVPKGARLSDLFPEERRRRARVPRQREGVTA